jgi:Ni,Fe-hydrogenase III small subunit
MGWRLLRIGLIDEIRVIRHRILVTDNLFPQSPQEDLQRLTDWVRVVHEERHRDFLTLVGADKTQIIDHLRADICAWPSDQQAFAHSVNIAQGGVSMGGLLLHALEHMEKIIPVRAPECPDNVLPIIWALIHSATFPEGEGQVVGALRRARDIEAERVLLAEDLSRWLRQQPLTSARVQASGLTRSIDWEGDLIHILADLLRFARECGLLRTLFFFVDQIEDLFRPSFSIVRRSRLLTDLKALVDEVDRDAPIGLLLAWDAGSDFYMGDRYKALTDRLKT